ncbi:MAG: aldo/keto reductase [Lactobacillus sp.]|jgi:diketogulonate reductase-like aldo/keto reductase|nr:aldo/keto reductase [Lactobacillus sp.]MCH4068494.1 aldo/keto reductase [Lactobacillus sp.]MCI1304243.1 aldo/keto reductase [Lactobacillus sp.]MCI1330456.1 aldo/keto reductase [Lactobacillus sp.]MCI1359250.1 aldo/keto reductase [Lactobacillus sp.]
MQYLTWQNERLSNVGVGTWLMGEDSSKESDEIAAIRYAVDHGVNVIDTAEMYGDGKSEILVGKAIKGLDRDKLFLISKFLPYHAKPEQERTSLEASLKRLGTDYLDLYLLHWRGHERLSRTVQGLEELKRAGLIRHWGVSNFDVDDLEELYSVPGGDQCFVNEDLYNLTARGVEYDLLPWQQQHKLGFIGYSPFNSDDGDSIRVTNNLKIVARNHQLSTHQIMLAWCLRSGQVLSIPKAGNIAHMRDNLAASGVKFTPDELKLLDADWPKPIAKTPLATI